MIVWQRSEVRRHWKTALKVQVDRIDERQKSGRYYLSLGDEDFGCYRYCE